MQSTFVMPNYYQRDSIVTTRADTQQGMESGSQFKMNTVTEIYLQQQRYNMTLSFGVLFSVAELI